MKKFLFILISVLISLSIIYLAACTQNINSGSASNSGAASSSTSAEDNANYVDVFMFMGQSNMAGRGRSSAAAGDYVGVTCPEGHGYEFRAVTDPTKLYPIEEPFGVNENNTRINDGTKKTGSLVSSFCEAYYEKSGVPIIAVSASQGGTNITEWQSMIDEAIDRLENCLNYIYSQDTFTLRHIEMVWLQGESNAYPNKGEFSEYAAGLKNIVNKIIKHGVEHCFIIQIGNYMSSVNEENYQSYKVFQQKQVEFCDENEDYTLVSIKLADMPDGPDDGFMHISNHYTQKAYDIVGTDAGRNAAYYMNTGLKPTCKAYNAATDFYPFTEM